MIRRLLDCDQTPVATKRIGFFSIDFEATVSLRRVEVVAD